MTVSNNLKKISKSLDKLSSTTFDIEKYTRSLSWQTSELEFYYCYLQKNGFEYKLKNRPKSHQLAYFNIGRGLPNELMDGHWCYILKDLGNKMLIVPTCSIKKDISNPYFEMDVQTKNKLKHSRLKLSEIRTVDILRLYEDKGYVDVTTSRHEIQRAIKNILFDNNIN